VTVTAGAVETLVTVLGAGHADDDDVTGHDEDEPMEIVIGVH